MSGFKYISPWASRPPPIAAHILDCSQPIILIVYRPCSCQSIFFPKYRFLTFFMGLFESYSNVFDIISDNAISEEVNMLELVSGQLPPGQLPPGQLPPGQLPPRGVSE